MQTRPNMNRPSFFRSLIVGMTTAVVISHSLSSASAAGPADQRISVRGTVIALNSNKLEVKSRDGNNIIVALAPGWAASAVVKATIEDIKPGGYVGIASLPTSEGGDGALEVLIFPPPLKGTAEGSFAYDLKPRSTMTNATVADAVKSVSGSVVTVNFHGQEKKISIPQGTPVVTLAPATPDDVKPGSVIFIPALKGADGSISAGNVIVGKDGVVPPM